MSSDNREPLVETSLQVLCVCLENDVETVKVGDQDEDETVSLEVSLSQTGDSHE